MIVSAVIIIGLLSTVGTVAVGQTTRSLQVAQEMMQSDDDTVTTLMGNKRAGSNKSANGETCPGIDAQTGDPELRNDWTKKNWLYKVRVEETSDDAWPAGRIYKVEVYGDGNLLTTSPLYFQNSTAQSSVEGVRLFVDVGSKTEIPDTFTSIITMLTSCP
jgi:hypothetical protein|tara:strand:- start:406 stop:885 length:480 start_codon:yes stop_codon:yes gene_type:complete